MLPSNTSHELAPLATLIGAIQAGIDDRALAALALEQTMNMAGLSAGEIWAAEAHALKRLACHPEPASEQPPEPSATIMRVFEQALPQWLEHNGNSAEAVLPLISRGRCVGVFTAAGEITAQQRQQLSTIADLLAGAFQQTRMAEQIAGYQRELQTIKRQHDELISVISHDLKNPMASIKGYADLLLRRSAKQPDDPNRRGLQVISEQIVRMSGLLDTLLDVTRIASQRTRIDRRPADLAQIVRQVVDNLRETAGGRELTFEGADSPYRGLFDTQRILQVVEHVLRNALMYSPPEQPIEVQLHRQNQQALLTIRDYGGGISADECERIFEPFYRGSSAAGSTGLGMGLYIAQQILARHDGAIWCDSVEGEGSIFRLTLPLETIQTGNNVVTADA